MTRVDLLWTFVAQLAAATKICPQLCQNAAATEHTPNMASNDTDDDVIFIAEVLVSGAECKKEANKCKQSICTH